MKLSHCALPLLCAVLALPAHAEKADMSKPVQVEADSLRYDGIKQVTVFSGKVVLTRGSITIRGDRLELTQDRDGYQYGSVTGSAKEPAFFRQKREGLDEFWEGEAEAVIYNGKADKVLLDKSAVLRRFRGKTKTDEISGAQITYENASEHFSVDGAALPQAGASRTRARVTYEPQNADSPPNTRAPSAPASKTP